MFHIQTGCLRVGSAISIAASLVGCTLLQSPYSDRPTFRQGEKSSVAFAAISDQNTYDCKDESDRPIPGCKFIGKVILTKPTDNVSYQVFIDEPNPEHAIDSKQPMRRQRVVMCASPAEAAKTVSASAALALALNVKVASAPASEAASASNSVTETLMALSAQDAPSHYVAVASYANCLAYASGMVDAKTAAHLQEVIFNNAKDIAKAK